MAHDDTGEVPPLRQLLAPWIACASVRVDMTVDTLAPAADVVRDLWIDWCIQDDNSFTMKDVEAMELLELYARVDYEDAWSLILELVEQRPFHGLIMEETLSGSEGRVYPRFVIYNVEGLHTAGIFRRVADYIVFPIPPAAHSPTFESMRSQLLNRYAAQHNGAQFRRSASELIQVKFHFDLNWWSANDAVRGVLRDVAAICPLAEDPRRRQILGGDGAEDARPSAVFVLKAVLPRWDAGPVTDEMLQSLETIGTTSISIERLMLGSAQLGVDEVSLPAIAKFFRTLLVADNNQQAMALTSRLSLGVCVAAYSALQKATSVKYLTVRFPLEGIAVRDWWVWLAYTVFSNEATGKIKRLDLEVGGLTDAHIDIFEEALQSRDPLVYVSPARSGQSRELVEARSQRDPVVVSVRPQSALLFRADTINELVSMKTTDVIESLRVVDDDPDCPFVCVVYPGAGICWVDRNDIVARHALPQPPSPPCPRLERLGLAFDEDTPLAPLVRLIQTIGREVRTLVVHCLPGRRVVPTSFLRSIVEACPHLDRLDLSQLEFADFHWLSPTRLQSLMLDSVKTTDPDQYARLLGDIAGGRTSLTQFHVQNDQRQLSDIEAPTLRMLDGNHVLERFFVSFDSEAFDGTIPVPAQAQALRQRNGVPLNIQRAPFSLRSKLALISVTHSADLSTEKQPSLVPELDAALMAHIFDYAAPHKTRVCGATPFKEMR